MFAIFQSHLSCRDVTEFPTVLPEGKPRIVRAFYKLWNIEFSKRVVIVVTAARLLWQATKSHLLLLFSLHFSIPSLEFSRPRDKWILHSADDCSPVVSMVKTCCWAKKSDWLFNVSAAASWSHQAIYSNTAAAGGQSIWRLIFLSFLRARKKCDWTLKRKTAGDEYKKNLDFFLSTTSLVGASLALGTMKAIP